MSGYDRDYYLNRGTIEVLAYKNKEMRQDMGCALAYLFGAESYELAVESFVRVTSSFHDSVWEIGKTFLERPRLVFDIGCGRGELSMALDWMGCQVVAFDPSEAAIDICRETSGSSSGVTWVCSDFAQAAMWGGRVDAVVFSESIEHIHPEEFEFAWPKLEELMIEYHSLLVVTNWVNYFPIKVESFDHVMQVDEALYSRLSRNGRVVVRHGSHLVVRF